ncbi:LysM peptidoglycan-binding domain-containing protein [Vagococcus elongatus]|nr:LysM peptidoglycan-binding domain-containing protein [Vagococcus elongatus]
MSEKRSERKRNNHPKSPVIFRKGASLLSASMVVGSALVPTLEGIKTVKASELDPEQPKMIDQQETEKLPDIETTKSSEADEITVNSQEETVGSSEEIIENGEPSGENVNEESTEEVLYEGEEGIPDGPIVTEEKELKENAFPTGMVAMYRSARSYSAFSSEQDFIQTIGDQARTVAARNDLYASIMIAQAILESGWGSSALSLPPNHNLFGIKGSYQGQSVTMQTWEHINGKDIIVPAAFRKYPSYSESLQDNANVLRNTSFSAGNYFYSGAWKSNTRSFRDATAWLTGRYATDPAYGSKLNSIIDRYGLTSYDTQGGSGNTNTGNENTGNSGNNSGGTVVTPPTAPDNNSTKHTVRAGDTLYGIALKYGVTVAQLKSWNNLKSDTIYVGNVLTVKNSVSGGVSGGGTSSNNNQNNSNNNQSTNGTYTIKAGDTLYGIALKHGVTVAQLKSWNNLSSDMIYVGQTLKLNTSGSSSSGSGNTGSSGNQSSTPSGNTTHTVKAGDTLYGLGLKYGVTVAQLRTWNNLKSDTIFIGQQLKINSKGAATGNSNTTNNTNNSASTDSTKSYTVKSGDTLYGIALKYNVSVSQLKSWNGLSSDLIYVGQKIKLKTSTSAGTTAPSNNQSTNTTASYTIKSGDTLYGIAAKYGVTVSQLKSWNNLKSDVIYVGGKLKISSSSSNTSNPNKTETSANTSTSKTTYTIKSGDTLFAIAAKYGVSVAQLKSWNSLKNDIIHVGQKLNVNQSASTSTKPASGSSFYSVKAGDSLWKISGDKGVSVSQLKQWNQLTNDLIYVGQSLRVK